MTCHFRGELNCFCRCVFFGGRYSFRHVFKGLFFLLFAHHELNPKIDRLLERRKD